MQLYRVIVPVGDIGAATQFYAQLLDLPGNRVSPGRHYFPTGPAILAVVDLRADGQDRDPRPNQEHLYFSTPDLFAARVRAAAAGPAEGPSEIRSWPWGETSFDLTDPWGNPLCVVAAGSGSPKAESLSPPHSVGWGWTFCGAPTRVSWPGQGAR